MVEPIRGRVITLGLLHVKRFSVRPRVCKTDFTQIGTGFLILRLPTFFKQEQNFVDKERAFGISLLNSSRREMELNRLTHTRDDACGISSYYSQSVGPGRYNTMNLVPDAKKVNPLSVQNVVVYPREGFGANNAQIDAESVLKNQPEFKNNRCLIRAQARPFLTVPYMGTGRGNSDVESMLMHSEQVRQGAECGSITEKGFDGAFEPLIKTVRENIQAPKHLVTEVAANGWIRGGIPSRAYVRDVNC